MVSCCILYSCAGKGVKPSLVALSCGWTVAVGGPKLVSNIMRDACTMKEALHTWAFRRKRRPRAWDVSPSAIMWVLWKERNMRVFEEVDNAFEKLQNDLSFLAFWCTHEVFMCINDWFLSLTTIFCCRFSTFWYRLVYGVTPSLRKLFTLSKEKIQNKYMVEVIPLQKQHHICQLRLETS